MKDLIYINKNPAGKINNFIFGLCSILSGLITVLSFGFLSTKIVLNFSRYSARKSIQKTKLTFRSRI